MKKFTQILESNNLDIWKFMIDASFEGFDSCRLTGKIEVERGTPEGDVGEMIDKKMDEFPNLTGYNILTMDKIY